MQRIKQVYFFKAFPYNEAIKFFKNCKLSKTTIFSQKNVYRYSCRSETADINSNEVK